MDTSAIIDRLGGTKKTADICKVRPAAVTLWRATGMPPRHWETVVAHAKERGIDGITFDAIQAARQAARAQSATA